MCKILIYDWNINRAFTVTPTGNRHKCYIYNLLLNRRRYIFILNLMNKIIFLNKHNTIKRYVFAIKFSLDTESLPKLTDNF